MYGLALENQQRITGEGSTEVTPILVNLGSAHLGHGDVAEAGPLFEKAYAIRKEVREGLLSAARAWYGD